MEKYSILEINGGIGKSIMASAVCEAIKTAHPDRKLIVITGWPEPLLHNPNIYRVYKAGSILYFYEDFIKGNDVLFFNNEPYQSNGYLNQNQHLIQSWCEAISVPLNNEKPKIFLNPREMEEIFMQFQRPKPIMLIQPFGGMGKRYLYGWNRDLPPNLAQELINIYSQKYHVIQVGYQDQNKLQNVEYINLGIREVLALAQFSKARILIDSFLQHACAAFNLPSTVCWITNSPKVFGYDIHKNVLARTDNFAEGIHGADWGTQQWDFTGNRLHDFPFKDHNIFNIDEIVNTIPV